MSLGVEMFWIFIESYSLRRSFLIFVVIDGYMVLDICIFYFLFIIY